MICAGESSLLNTFVSFAARRRQMKLIVFSDDMRVRKNSLRGAYCVGAAHAGSAAYLFIFKGVSL